jgi:hypothetical protein
MKTGEKIKKLFFKSNVTVNPEVDDKILGDTLGAFEKSMNTTSADYRPNVWRIIMKNKMTKFAAAAVIILGVALSIIFLEKSVTPAYAIEQAFEAMENMHWMHILGKQNDLQLEHWISYPEKIIASKHSTGKTTYQHDQMCYSYDINDNILVISQSSGDAFEFLGNSPLGFIDHLKKMIKETEGEISKKTTEYLQKKTIVYNMSIIMEDRDLSLELVTDFEKKLPLLLKWNQVGNNNEPAIDAELYFDYPSSGPEDIYAIGVPKDAIVDNIVPSGDISYILDFYRDFRNNFTSEYAAVVTHTYWFDNHLTGGLPRQVDIIYRKENCQRVDSYGIPSEHKAEYQQDPVTLSNEMGNSFDALYSWWTKNPISMLAQVNLYDGKFLYQCRQDNQNKWSQLPRVYSTKNNFRADDDIADFGWDIYLLSLPNDPQNTPLKIVENDYSIQHNLICLETTTQGQTIIDSVEKVWAVAPSRKRYYLNPQKDYACQRFEQEERFDATWQKDESWYIRAKEQEINENPCVNIIRDISDWGKTDSGQWYPKEIRTWNPVSPEQSLRIKKIYLETIPVFPENVFNPKALPK